MPEEDLIRYCSPTLAGLKAGALFNCPYTNPAELKACLRAWNCRLGGKGLRVVPVRWAREWALLYVYRPGRLARDPGRAGL